MEDCRRRSTKKGDEGEAEEEESRKWAIHISLPFDSVTGVWKECSPAGSSCSFLPSALVMSSRQITRLGIRIHALTHN